MWAAVAANARQFYWANGEAGRGEAGECNVYEYFQLEMQNNDFNVGPALELTVPYHPFRLPFRELWIHVRPQKTNILDQSIQSDLGQISRLLPSKGI